MSEFVSGAVFIAILTIALFFLGHCIEVEDRRSHIKNHGILVCKDETNSFFNVSENDIDKNKTVEDSFYFYVKPYGQKVSYSDCAIRIHKNDEPEKRETK